MIKIIASLLIGASLVGCSTFKPTPTEYHKATIRSVYNYQTEENDPSIGGAVVGGGVGGLLGNQVGKGKGRTAMTVLGTVIGAGVGSNVAGGKKTVQMSELNLLFENGTYYVAKYENLGWKVGQKVMFELKGKYYTIRPL